jgi:hypothetical protein
MTRYRRRMTPEELEAEEEAARKRRHEELQENLERAREIKDLLDLLLKHEPWRFE